MPTITPFLWFDTQAQEAMLFYTSIFKDSKVISVQPKPNVGAVRAAGPALHRPERRAAPQVHRGRVVLRGSRHAGTRSTITEDACSWPVAAGPDQCGWLKDKFGLSWQIVPAALSQMLGDADASKSQRVMTALMQMDKLDVNVLEAAFKGE